MHKKINPKEGSCPICNNLSTNLIDLNTNFIKNKLSNHFNNEVGSNVEICDYSLMKCNNCDFEYAFPFKEGSSSFYDWITSQEKYYPVSRWEYKKTLDVIQTRNDKIKLLDVGCGDGKYLDFLKANSNGNIDFSGLDPTKLSAEMCLEKGHKVFCKDINEFKNSFKNELFDAVTVFHVLEHIANPKLFLKELLTLINPSGKILISTPYSPMELELEWFDILNHPPHHMGRWNLKSYKSLALELNLNVKSYFPKPNSIFRAALASFIISIYGPSKSLSKKQRLLEVIKKPINFVSHVYKQSKREKISNQRIANVVLVEFTKK